MGVALLAYVVGFLIEYGYKKKKKYSKTLSSIPRAWAC